MFIGFEIENIVCTPLERLTNIEEVKNCKPIEETINLIREIKQAGHQIILYTKRDSSLGQETENWLSRHKVPYDRIMFNRPSTPILFFSNDSRQFNNATIAKEELVKHGILQAPEETTHSETTTAGKADDNSQTKDTKEVASESNGTSSTKPKENSTGIQILK